MMANPLLEPTDTNTNQPDEELVLPENDLTTDAQHPEDEGAGTGTGDDDTGTGTVDADNPSGAHASEAKVKIIRDGKEEEIPLSEAANGYMRHDDYTRKTQELSRQRTDVQAREQRVQTELSQRVNQLGTLAQALYQELVGDQSSLNALADNPTAYIQKQNEMSRKSALLAQVQQTMEGQRQAQAQEQAKTALERSQRSDAELSRLIPEWNDPGKRAVIQKDIAGLLTEVGYSPQELASITDHRALMVARDAVLWRKHQALSAHKAAPRIATPVTGNGGTPDQSKLARAKERFKAHPDSIEALGDLGAAAGSL